MDICESAAMVPLQETPLLPEVLCKACSPFAAGTQVHRAPPALRLSGLLVKATKLRERGLACRVFRQEEQLFCELRRFVGLCLVRLGAPSLRILGKCMHERLKHPYTNSFLRTSIIC